MEVRHIALWLGLAFVLIFSLRSSAEEASPVPALKIGVVDMSRVFDAYKKRDDFNKTLEEFRRQKAQEIENRRVEIRRLQDKIQLLAPGSEERKSEEENLSRKRLEFETEGRLAAQEVDQKYRALLAEIYRDISEQVKRFSEENGYDLILKTEALETDTSSTAELKLRLSTQKILYYSPRLDVTGKIIEVLNKEYKELLSGKEK